MFLLIALIAGSLLTFAFAPYNIYTLALICPALLLYALTQKRWRKKQSFLLGFLFGLGLMGFGAHWLYYSIQNFGGVSVWLSCLITALFVLLQACFYGAMSLAFTWLSKTCRHAALFQHVTLFPLLWIIFEALRASIPWGGFPWLLLGYSQLHTPLIGYAPIFGVYGVSFFVALSAGALIYIARNKNLKKTIALLAVVFALWFIGESYRHHVWVKPYGTAPLKATLVQGNVPQSLKWDPQVAGKALRFYSTQTQQHFGSDLIVWPEAAITYTPSSIQPYLKTLSQHAKQHHAAVLTGEMPYINGHYYNAAALYGTGTGLYLKKHLVPFGEYYPGQDILAPLMSKLKIPMSDLAAGPSKQPLLTFQWHGLPVAIAPFICYEIAYANEVRDAALHSNLLVTITDDAWFGKSIARAQHLQMAAMRSVETQRPQLFASNNGITAIIQPNGVITKTVSENTPTSLTSSVVLVHGATPWMNW